jgi:hypothetical protein
MAGAPAGGLRARTPSAAPPPAGWSAPTPHTHRGDLLVRLIGADLPLDRSTSSSSLGRNSSITPVGTPGCRAPPGSARARSHTARRCDGNSPPARRRPATTLSGRMPRECSCSPRQTSLVPSRDQLRWNWHHSAKTGEGTPAAEPAGNGRSCRADLVAVAGQFSWPPAGSYLAASGQFLVAAVSGRRSRSQRRYK